MHSIRCFLNFRSDNIMDFNDETDFVFECLLGAYILSLRQHRGIIVSSEANYGPAGHLSNVLHRELEVQPYPPDGETTTLTFVHYKSTPW